MVRSFLVLIMVVGCALAESDFDVVAFGSGGKRKMLYDVRQRPASVLMDGRLYVVYNGDAKPTKNKKGDAVPLFISYGLETGQFTEPVAVGPRSTDHHDAPILWADEANHLHILYGCHRSPGTYLISAKPVVDGRVVIEWKKAERIAPKLSYPTVYRVWGDREVIAYRTDGHTSSWTYRISEDDGKSWKGPNKDVTDLDSQGRTDWSAYRTVLPSKDGKHLHMVYTDYDDYITKLTPDRLFNSRYNRIVNNQWKYNLSYVKIELETGVVRNADGKELKTPIHLDYSKEHCEIWDTEGRGAGVPPAMCLDRNGEPAFLHVLSEDDLRTHRYYYVRRENGKWLKTPIRSSNHQWNSGHLMLDKDGALRAYVIVGEGYREGGYMDEHGGGDVEEWISKDHGNTWAKGRSLNPAGKEFAGWRFNNIQPVVRPDGSAVEGMLLFYGWPDEDAPTGKAFLARER
jgi:hypothetical protein